MATDDSRKESPPRGYQSDGGLVPVPDPTLLTTQALLREVASLKELMEVRISANAALYDQKIAEEGAISREKFAAVAAQFSERDTRTDQRAGDTKLAVDAAFAAAKEATAKIEAGFTKQIDGMNQIIDTKTRNIEGNLSDLKERMISIESRSTTTTDIRRDNRDHSGLIVAAISALIAFGALIALILTRMHA
jgi:hypothetical protein